MFLRCCSLLVPPETVLWGTGPVGCVGAVSDQCAEFDATLGWESVAMPPSVICPDTWLVLWMVTLLSPADWFIRGQNTNMGQRHQENLDRGARPLRISTGGSR